MCLACQHFDFNSADWISDNLHVISSWYLRTMGKEFIFRFSRRSWGRNAWRTPKNVCVGGYRSKELEDVGRVASSFPTHLGKIEATLLAGYWLGGPWKMMWPGSGFGRWKRSGFRDKGKILVVMAGLKSRGWHLWVNIKVPSIKGWRTINGMAQYKDKQTSVQWLLIISRGLKTIVGYTRKQTHSQY